MQHDRDFWDKIAPKYANDPIKDEAAYELTLERTLSYLGPQSRVLELGCGTGSTALRIAAHVRTIKGTDLSGAMIGIAKAKAAEEGAQNADFEAASVAKALEDDAQYNAILGFNLFHLVDASPARFAEIAHKLSAGGLFISKTPCLSAVSWPKRALFTAMIAVLKLIGKAPSYVRSYTFKELESEIEGAGFEIVETLCAPAMSRYIVARKR